MKDSLGNELLPGMLVAYATRKGPDLRIRTGLLLEVNEPERRLLVRIRIEPKPHRTPRMKEMRVWIAADAAIALKRRA